MFSSLFTTKAKQMNTMTTTQLHEQLEMENELYLIDVRSPDEYATGHIQGARLLPLNSIKQRLNEIPKDVPIVCVCMSGSRSAVASELLVKAGYSSVQNLSGGMMSWIRNGYQVVR